MRISAKLGLAEQTETSPGVWEETITEVPVLGEMKQTTDVLSGGEDVLPRHTTTTSIAVYSRRVGLNDNSSIRYIVHKGKRWQMSSIVDQPPLIVLFIGEEYHGPAPE
jgi:hypothetical protein